MCRVITFSAFVAMGSPPCWSGSFLHKQMTLMCRCELVGTSSWEQVEHQARLEEGKQTRKERPLPPPFLSAELPNEFKIPQSTSGAVFS